MVKFNILFAFLFFKTSREAPLNRQHIFDKDNILQYLTSFGYLPNANSGKLLLVQEDGLKLALKDLEIFSGVKSSESNGNKIEDKILKIMSIPRCGLPDLNKSSESDIDKWSRSKRSILQVQLGGLQNTIFIKMKVKYALDQKPELLTF